MPIKQKYNIQKKAGNGFLNSRAEVLEGDASFHIFYCSIILFKLYL